MQVMFTAIIQSSGFTGQFGQVAKAEELYRTGFFGPDLRHLVGEDQVGDPLPSGQVCPELLVLLRWVIQKLVDGLVIDVFLFWGYSLSDFLLESSGDLLGDQPS